MASSLQRIAFVGIGTIALVWAGVRGNEALTAYAKDRREIQDPIAKLQALRTTATEYGLASADVPAPARPAGDALPVLKKIGQLMTKDRELAEISNGLTDSEALDKATNAPEIRALVAELLQSTSYLPFEKMDSTTLFGSISRSSERIAVRIACTDAIRDAKQGHIDEALTKINRSADFVANLADHLDDNGIIAWYSGCRLVITALTITLHRPDLTPEQFDKAQACLDRVKKSPQLEAVCVRMMNAMVAVTRVIDKLPSDDIFTLNMNGMNTHLPATDEKSKQSMESGLLSYWTECVRVAQNKSASPLDRGLEIDLKLNPLQKEDRVDTYMLRTITPTVFQIGQTITRAAQINSCCRALLAASRIQAKTKSFPKTLPEADKTFDVDGCKYTVEYIYDPIHPAATIVKEKMTDYDVLRHVSVDPANGVYVNL